MFTGLVADKGTVRSVHAGRLEIETALGAHLVAGDSAARRSARSLRAPR